MFDNCSQHAIGDNLEYTNEETPNCYPLFALEFIRNIDSFNQSSVLKLRRPIWFNIKMLYIKITFVMTEMHRMLIDTIDAKLAKHGM